MDYGNELLQRLVATYDGAAELVEEYGPEVTEALINSFSLWGLLLAAIGVTLLALGYVLFVRATRLYRRHTKKRDDFFDVYMPVGFMGLVSLILIVAGLFCIADGFIWWVNPVGVIAARVLL